MLAAFSESDLHTLLIILAFLCLCGAAYAAWLRNALAAVLLVFVAIVCFLVAD